MAVARSAPVARVASVMRASPYLRGLPAPWLRRLSAAATQQALAAGAQLETPADEPCLYLVVTGEVSVWSPAARGEVAEIVGEEGPGAMFGSRAITGEDDVPVYRAATPVDVCVWRAADLQRAYEATDGLQRHLDLRLSARRRERELVALLRRTPLFAHVSQALIRWLVRASTLRLYESGDAVCRTGEAGDAMFVIAAGEIAISRPPEPAGPDVTSEEPVARLHRGDFFGEIALVRASVRTASALALSDAELLVVPRHAFDVLDARSAAFQHAVRLAAQRRADITLAGERGPELVWLVNHDERCSTARLAGLVAEALGAIGAPAAPPQRLRTGAAVASALEDARRAGATYAVCFGDGPLTGRLARRVAEAAGSVVVVGGDAAAPLSQLRTTFDRVHHVVIAPPDGGAAAQPVRRDAIVLRARPADLRRPSLDRLPDHAQGGLRRIARAVARRRVGLALGGGAAWGYAHVALIRALEREQIPIDLIVGVSMGSFVGAFYASQGVPGLDRLVAANLELTAAAIGALASTQTVNLFLRRHIPESCLEELALPLATVAVDARTAHERIFRHGSLSAAVRASSSLPGLFGPSVLGGHRYLDGVVRHNVPASYCIEAGADFVIACDVVPVPGIPRHEHHRGLRGAVMELTQLHRVTDAVRSLYWLTSDSGQRQASVADAVFSPDLAEFAPWDFPRARAIVERAEGQLAQWLPATAARYRTIAQVGRADG